MTAFHRCSLDVCHGPLLAYVSDAVIGDDSAPRVAASIIRVILLPL